MNHDRRDLRPRRPYTLRVPSELRPSHAEPAGVDPGDIAPGVIADVRACSPRVQNGIVAAWLGVGIRHVELVRDGAAGRRNARA